MEEKYLEAKSRLSDLRNELASLPRLLAEAMEVGDTQNAVRLKARQRDLPFELEAQGVSVIKTELAYLEDLNAADRRELAKVRAKSQELDTLGAAAIQVLNDERTRIKNEALAELSRKHQLTSTIERREAQIRDVRRRLSEMSNNLYKN